MSDTARTDTALYQTVFRDGFHSLEQSPNGAWVKADFARQMERELAEAHIKIKHLSENVSPVDWRMAYEKLQHEIPEHGKLYIRWKAMALGKTNTEQLEALRYALGLVQSRRILHRTKDYLAAIDELETFLMASIERLQNGEPMHATAVCQESNA